MNSFDEAPCRTLSDRRAEGPSDEDRHGNPNSAARESGLARFSGEVKIVADFEEESSSARRRLGSGRWQFSSERPRLSFPREAALANADPEAEQQQRLPVLRVGPEDLCEWLTPLGPFLERLELFMRSLLNAGGLAVASALDAAAAASASASPSPAVLAAAGPSLSFKQSAPLHSFNASLRVWGATPDCCGSEASSTSLDAPAASPLGAAARRRLSRLATALRSRVRGFEWRGDSAVSTDEEEDGSNRGGGCASAHAETHELALEGWETDPRKWLPLLPRLRPFVLRDLLLLFLARAERLQERLLPFPSRAERIHNPSLDFSTQQDSIPSVASANSAASSSAAASAKPGGNLKESRSDETQDDCAPGRFFSGLGTRRPGDDDASFSEEVHLEEQAQLREIFVEHGRVLKRSVLLLQQRQQQPLHDEASRLTQQFALLRTQVREAVREADLGRSFFGKEKKERAELLSLLLHVVAQEQRLVLGRRGERALLEKGETQPRRPSPLLKAFKTAFAEGFEEEDSLEEEESSYAFSMDLPRAGDEENGRLATPEGRCLQLRAWMRWVGEAAPSAAVEIPAALLSVVHERESDLCVWARADSQAASRLCD